ncbi:MAG: hypothetical protein Kow0062_20340 [Acidobacteriota bacterium]
MTDRLVLALYVTAVAVASAVHDPRALGAGLALVLAGSGRAAPRIVRRLAWSVAPVLVLVVAGWLVTAALDGAAAGPRVAAFALRVLLITALTLAIVPRIDPFRALAFSRTATLLLVIAVSQALTLRRLWDEMRLARRARAARRPGLVVGWRHAAAAAGLFVHKGLAQAADTALAMRARGWIDDRR